MRSWALPLLLFTFLAILQGCVGDDCDSDDECLSGSCSTFGTCDSAVIEAIFREREDTPASPENREPILRCVQQSCEWLAGRPENNDCTKTPGCRRVMTHCLGFQECSIDSLVSATCPEPCYSRGEDTCNGGCVPSYTCEQEPLDCASRTSADCGKVPGCMVVNS